MAPDLDHNELKTLCFVSNHENVTNKQLMDTLGYRDRTRSRVITSLNKRNYIKTRSLQDDNSIDRTRGRPLKIHNIIESGRKYIDDFKRNIIEYIIKDVVTRSQLEEYTGLKDDELDSCLKYLKLNKVILHICDLYALQDPKIQNELIKRLYKDFAKSNVSIEDFAEKLMESFIFKECEAKEYVGFIDMFINEKWEWWQIFSLLGHMKNVAETNLGLSWRLKDELMKEITMAYYDYLILISQAALHEKVDIPSGSRFSGSQMQKAVTEGKIDMDVILGVNFLTRPQLRASIVFKPESTPFIESTLFKRRRLKFREMIFDTLKVTLLPASWSKGFKWWKFKRMVGELFLTNKVDLGVRHLKGFGSCRVYMGLASQLERNRLQRRRKRKLSKGQ